MYDLLIKNAKLVTFNDQDEILPHAHLLIHNGQIINIILDKAQSLPHAKRVIDHKGKLMTPGLIDCHTHLIYGGSRAHEFEMCLKGTSYEEIAQNGGGILSTVYATRQASFNSLFLSAKKRLEQMQQWGVTICEIKSGYGLDFETEIKMLKVAEKLGQSLPVRVIPTFLAAHALAPEYESKDDYIREIANVMLPKLSRLRLCRFIDGFCENIAFSRTQIHYLFEKAQSLNFKLKLHAEQLSNQKGAALAAQMGACSVDHLEYLEPGDIPLLKKHKTTAVLLPGAYYFLNETQKPPVSELLAHNIDIAIATDANPGSSPFLSLPLMMNMACILFGLTSYEAFKATTINAAKALDMQKTHGSIEIGKQADIILWDCDSYNEIIYNSTYNYRQYTIQDGVIFS